MKIQKYRQVIAEAKKSISNRVKKYSSGLSVDVNIYSTMKPKHNKSQEQT